jgi:phosphoribosyl 1,2-cyclic phosphodiesterase
MRLKFWGVRGSTPTPQLENLRYGGNTPCVEFRSDAGKLLIVDCGTGLRMLGRALLEEFGSRPIRADILISHFHWDHIQGLPFFIPLYNNDNQFNIYSYHSRGGLEQILGGQMTNPYFPVDMNAMHAKRQLTEIGATTLHLGDFRVQARLVNHPQGCLSFRVESNGKTAVYATDNEPGDPESDRTLRELCRDADLLIYDAQYSRAQLTSEKRGWGHSSWEDGIEICKQSGVKKFVLFHHDPDSDDRTVDRFQQEARGRFADSCAAFEVMEINL